MAAAAASMRSSAHSHSRSFSYAHSRSRRSSGACRVTLPSSGSSSTTSSSLGGPPSPPDESAILTPLVHETLARVCLGAVGGDEKKFLKEADELAKALEGRYGVEVANSLAEPLPTMLAYLLTTEPTRDVLGHFLYDEENELDTNMPSRTAAKLKGLASAVRSVHGQGVRQVYGDLQDSSAQMAALDNGLTLVGFVGDVLDGLHEVVARTHQLAQELEAAEVSIVEGNGEEGEGTSLHDAPIVAEFEDAADSDGDNDRDGGTVSASVIDAIVEETLSKPPPLEPEPEPEPKQERKAKKAKKAKKAQSKRTAGSGFGATAASASSQKPRTADSLVKEAATALKSCEKFHRKLLKERSDTLRTFVVLSRSACSADTPGFDSRLSDWLPVAEMTLDIPEPPAGAPSRPPSVELASAALQGLCLEAHASLDYIIGRKGFAFGASSSKKKTATAEIPPLSWAVEETHSYYLAEEALKTGAAGATTDGSGVGSVGDALRALNLESGATHEEIRRAYRKLSAKYHPDVNAGSDEAAKRYAEVRAANEVLKRRASNKAGTYEDLVPGGSRTPIQRCEGMVTPPLWNAQLAREAAAVMLPGMEYALAPLDRETAQIFMMRNSSRAANN